MNSIVNLVLSKPFPEVSNPTTRGFSGRKFVWKTDRSRSVLRIAIVATMTACLFTGGSVGAQTTETPTVDFFFDVAPIFSKRCFSCHGGDEPKGGFRIEDREALAALVVGNDLKNSTLWTDYLRADPNDPETTLMPPKSEGGPLPGVEMAVIRTWIEDGAQIPEAYHLGDSSTHENKPAPPEVTGPLGRAWAFVGYFHPAVVHFPLALLVAGGLGALLSFFVGVRAQDFAFYCLLLGAFGAVAAATMGWSFAAEQGYPSWRVLPSDEEGENFFIHRWMGVAVAVLSCLLLLIATVSRRRQDARSSAAWRVGLMIIALLVGWVGHEGGELTYPGLFDKAFHRLNGTKEEVQEAAMPVPPPDFEMRASS